MGIVLNTVQNQPDGTLDLDEVAKVIKPNDPHFAVAKVLALENTSNKLGGLVLPLEYMEKAGDFCERHGLKMHVDGARLWNAAVALKVPIAQLARRADSVNVCLSKGLGAPVGSILVGRTGMTWDDKVPLLDSVRQYVSQTLTLGEAGSM